MGNRSYKGRAVGMPTLNFQPNTGPFRIGPAANDNFGLPANDNRPRLPRPRLRTARGIRGLPRVPFPWLELVKEIIRLTNPPPVEGGVIQTHADGYTMLCGVPNGIPGYYPGGTCGTSYFLDILHIPPALAGNGFRAWWVPGPRSWPYPPVSLNTYKMDWIVVGKGQKKPGFGLEPDAWAPPAYLNAPGVGAAPAAFPQLDPMSLPNSPATVPQALPWVVLPWRGSPWPGIVEESVRTYDVPASVAPETSPLPEAGPAPSTVTWPPARPPKGTYEHKVSVLNPFGAGVVRTVLEWDSEVLDMVDIWYYNGLTKFQRASMGPARNRFDKLNALWQWRHALNWQAIWYGIVADRFMEKMQFFHGKQMQRLYRALHDEYGSAASVLAQGIYRLGRRQLAAFDRQSENDER